MADWKQITARIRRARTGKDPAGQLSNLFQKTSDAMVAFELAHHFESAGLNADAAKWYATAAERFRRADWKTKAQEAAVRLGGAVSETASPQSAPPDSADFVLTPPPILSSPAPEPELSFDQNIEVSESSVTRKEESPAAVPATLGETKHRRRGRRGGRNRRKPGTGKEPVATAGPRTPQTTGPHRGLPPAVYDQEPEEPKPPRVVDSRALPRLPVEPSTEATGIGLKGRYGDPGLSSRISLLEMQFRRLLTCPPAKLDEANSAPVGPGVFLLTDSDLTTYYYVEPCQTLRIAIGNLLRGGASRHSTESIKPRLAEHLGIAESRVAKYLAEHCVVRWLQLDEGASHFAHFVIAVLRPTLNE